MASTRDELIQSLEGIRDEYRERAITAYRLGTILMDMLDYCPDSETLNGQYIRKDIDDTASGLVNFEQGIRIQNGLLKWDEQNHALYVVDTQGNKANFYSTGSLTAKGYAPSEGGAGTGGLVKVIYGVDNFGQQFTKDKLDDTFNAYAINSLYERIKALEEGGLNNVDYTQIINKPSINGVILEGNKTTEELLIETGITSIDWNNDTITGRPDWIKSAEKPKYTYDEVGAAASNHTHEQYITSDNLNGFATKDWVNNEAKAYSSKGLFFNNINYLLIDYSNEPGYDNDEFNSAEKVLVINETGIIGERQRTIYPVGIENFSAVGHKHLVGDITGLQEILNNKLDASVFNELFEKKVINGITLIRAKFGLYTDGSLTAKGSSTGGGSPITTDYNQLNNKPKINGHTLEGNMTSEQLGIICSGGTTTSVNWADIDNKPEWVNSSIKPTYTCSEIGAAPADHEHEQYALADDLVFYATEYWVKYEAIAFSSKSLTIAGTTYTTRKYDESNDPESHIEKVLVLNDSGIIQENDHTLYSVDASNFFLSYGLVFAQNESNNKSDLFINGVTYDPSKDYVNIFVSDRSKNDIDRPLVLQYGYGNVGIGVMQPEYKLDVNGVIHGNSSSSVGYKTNASGECSHAEGGTTTSSGRYSHAEGGVTTSSGEYSHVEGYNNTAFGDSSHSEGGQTKAIGIYSHAEGYKTVTNNAAEHASGTSNVSHVGKTLFSIGNGTKGAFSNAFEVLLNGNIGIGLGEDMPTCKLDVGGDVLVRGNLLVYGCITGKAANSSSSGLVTFLYNPANYADYTSVSTNQAPTVRAVKLIKNELDIKAGELTTLSGTVGTLSDTIDTLSDTIETLSTNLSASNTSINKCILRINLIRDYLADIKTYSDLNDIRSVLMTLSTKL